MDTKKQASADFYSTFTKKTSELRTRIGALELGQPDLGAVMDDLRAEIRNMELSISDSSTFLPLYDQRKHMQTVRELNDELNAAQARVVPKGKFSFKRKPKDTSSNTVIKDKPVVDTKASNYAVESANVADDDTLLITVRSRVYRFVESPLHEKLPTDALLKNSSNSVVYLDTLNSLSTAHIVDTSNCIIVFQYPISGSLFVERCTNLKIIVACQQLRVHTSQKLDFYLHVISNPIIEDCKEVGFASVEKSGIEIDGIKDIENRFDKVEDFYWLKSTQSPNWRLLIGGEYFDFTSIISAQTSVEEILKHVT